MQEKAIVYFIVAWLACWLVENQWPYMQVRNAQRLEKSASS